MNRMRDYLKELENYSIKDKKTTLMYKTIKVEK